MSDDRHADDQHGESAARIIRFSPEAERKLFNLLDDSAQLERFSPEDKTALRGLIEDHHDLHAMAEAHRFAAHTKRWLKRLAVQCAAFLAFVVSLKELWDLALKLQLHRP